MFSEPERKLPSDASCSHVNLYKNNGVDSATLHKKHREETAEIRKKKRDESFVMSRRIARRNSVFDEDKNRAIHDPELVGNLMDDDEDNVIHALKIYSWILGSAQAVDEAVEMGLFNTFIDVFMKAESDTDVERAVVAVLSEMSMDVRHIAVVSLLNHYFSFLTPVDEITDDLLDLLDFILRSESDEQLLCETLETLAGIANFGIEHSEKLISKGFLQHTQPMLNQSPMVVGGLKFANAIADHVENVAVLFESGFFDAAWAVATSAQFSAKVNGQGYHLLAVFVRNGILDRFPDCAPSVIEKVLQSLSKSAFDVRAQALIVLHEILQRASGETTAFVVQKGALEPLCDLLTVMNVDVVLTAVKCLTIILNYGIATGTERELVSALEELNAIDKFDFLMNSQCYDIFKAADGFVSRFLERSEEND